MEDKTSLRKKRHQTDLANAINKIAKEEPRRANEKLLPFGSIRERNPKQRPRLLLPLHLLKSFRAINSTTNESTVNNDVDEVRRLVYQNCLC